MKRTFELFWRRLWDNLQHLVVVNFVWFLLSLPFFFTLLATLDAVGQVVKFETPAPSRAAVEEEAPAQAPSPVPAPGESPEAKLNRPAEAAPGREPQAEVSPPAETSAEQAAGEPEQPQPAPPTAAEAVPAGEPSAAQGSPEAGSSSPAPPTGEGPRPESESSPGSETAPETAVPAEEEGGNQEAPPEEPAAAPASTGRPSEGAPAATTAEEAAPAGARSTGSRSDAPPAATAAQEATTAPDAETPPPPRARPTRGELRLRLAFDLVLLAASWILFCLATGYVFWAMGDLVSTYDFGGYRHNLKRFLRRRPVLRALALVNVSFVTVFVAAVDVLLFLSMVSGRGLLLLLLPGVMLWFLIFASIVFSLALPLSIQMDLPVIRSTKEAAVMTLSQPGRGLLVIFTAFLILMLAYLSMAGVGFFALSAPAVLFHADVRARLEEQGVEY